MAYENTGAKKIYLASPFFCEEEIERVAFMEKVLREQGFDVFSPRENQFDQYELFSKEWREVVYLNDMKHLMEADMVVAIYDGEGEGSDQGTIFEVGAGIVAGKFVIVFTEKHDGINLMLTDSCHAFLKGRQEALDYDWKNLPTNYWHGGVR
ncbi:nucleoside 2-deoxyribosyltransferase [Bacillus wiedmannii]|uniref:nucleoside 2-deoxyribosyltransferase n=1 Tax=Bacillus wiedmannii TaxID=1890302 RepID=UPI003D213039